MKRKRIHEVASPAGVKLVTFDDGSIRLDGPKGFALVELSHFPGGADERFAKRSFVILPAEAFEAFVGSESGR